MAKKLDVKSLRTKLGLSQAKFGELCGVSQAQVTRWENGREPTGPAKIVLEMIARENAATSAG